VVSFGRCVIEPSSYTATEFGNESLFYVLYQFLVRGVALQKCDKLKSKFQVTVGVDIGPRWTDTKLLKSAAPTRR